MSNPIPVIIGGVSHLQTDFTASMTELSNLASANNLQVAAKMTQDLDEVNHQTYFGKGKIEELKQLAIQLDIKLIVVNDELTPAQLRNLEKSTKLNFLDRTELILQIFQHAAHSRQAQLQVAIAQLQYQLPRIHPSGNPLDQQRGSAGLTNRGAGESQLELDKRVIRHRISKYKQDLTKIQQTLSIQSQQRKQANLPQVALVGYTNAGKSTTLNGILELTQTTSAKKVTAKNQLFTTLDTAIRRIDLPEQTSFLLSDTVGFVSKLPHKLIEAFQSTLEEAKNADLLVQVIDYSDQDYQRTIQTTQQTLSQLGITDKPMIYAYNKANLVNIDNLPQLDGVNIYYDARNQSSIKSLVKLIEQQLLKNYCLLDVLIPFSQGQLVNYIQDNLTIQTKKYTDQGTQYQLLVNKADYQRLAPFKA
ncbi:GTPase HflX [Bombilactobacillus thymidiniphilus]|uniref:GTPase HflX n=1 Tax=Bombilactobacillus thymidiniphilus TaxID=2923363 RepID=A0ABY4PE90_9LACO|nr:GTPase HflX [Bombilactobacillus thymidiniphilus]UQS84109.1 GTPase HflX [Bombilactobacillus thymidiniphilus]